MRILLIGEYSGFYKNLAVGLRSLGHHVDWYAGTDGYKQIEGQTGGIRNTESRYGVMIEPFYYKKRYQGYDVVQMVCTEPFGAFATRPIYNFMRKKNKKIFVNISGTNNTTFEWFKEFAPKYNPDSSHGGRGLRKFLSVSSEKHVLRNVDGIIPIMYEYAQGYDEYKTLTEIIPLPMDTDNIEYRANKVDGKIVIFHGVSREEAKGTPFIREAMNIIKEKYPNDVEIVLEGRMPLKDYLELMKRTNVVIDQCKNFSWGMNTCYALAQGKIVLAPAREESLKAFGLKSCPIRQIEPEVNSIVHQLEKIIQEKHKIEQYGYESRKFVEEFHECKMIAQKYVDCWNSIN